MSEAKPSYSLSIIMSKAWGIARHGAKHFGGRPRQYLAEALRQCWAEAKKTAAEIAASGARVAACVAELKAKKLIAGSKPPVPYSSRFRRPFVTRV